MPEAGAMKHFGNVQILTLRVKRFFGKIYFIVSPTWLESNFKILAQRFTCNRSNITDSYTPMHVQVY